MGQSFNMSRLLLHFQILLNLFNIFQGKFIILILNRFLNVKTCGRAIRNWNFGIIKSAFCADITNIIANCIIFGSTGNIIMATRICVAYCSTVTWRITSKILICISYSATILIFVYLANGIVRDYNRFIFDSICLQVLNGSIYFFITKIQFCLFQKMCKLF